MLKGKHVLIGITGSIAAYKIANLVSALKKEECRVTVLMTENATKFIHPITMETLSGEKCYVDTFDRNFEHKVSHVSLSKSADILLIAPATANIIGKIAGGIADDMLSTITMAFYKTVLIAPAMNRSMYQNPIVQENIQYLKEKGYHFIEPEVGRLACGDIGIGKLPELEVLVEAIKRNLTEEIEQKEQKMQEYYGKKVLVTAGPTREALDPVRYITNYSSGRMGYAIAEEAVKRGAEVLLVTGPTDLPIPEGVNRVISITTAEEMEQAVKKEYSQQDIIIMSAAVADYRPVCTYAQKIKKKEETLTLTLERTTDILQWLGENKKCNQILCGFSMETEHMVEQAEKKLNQKKLDLIVANNIKEEGAGFQVETNKVTLLTKNEKKELPLMSKKEVAKKILTEVALIIKPKKDYEKNRE